MLSLNALAQKHYERLSAIDIRHYRFELNLTDQSDEINGRAAVTVKFKKDQDAFSLDLKKKAGEKGMEVLGVSSENQKVPFNHEGEMLKLSYPAKAGEIREFLITYRGIPETGLIISKNKYGDRTFFGDNWPDRGHQWLPVVDHPSDKATVEWIVRAPSHYQVIGNGRLRERTNLSDDLTLTHWASDVVLPVKVMVIGAARFAVQESGEVYGIPITSWIYPQDREKGFYDYAQAVPIMDWFINHVGPYPYAKLANVQSKTQFGGMENASNIFYAENSVTGNRASEGLIAHEIAHQWFGNSASEANWHHIWLSEGFATYFTNLYMEQKYGRPDLVRRLKEQREQVIAYSRQNRVPIVNPAVENYMELLNPNSYQKGGWVLHMLRKEVGDDIFWESIRAYYRKFTLSNALTSDLKEVFEVKSGKDLDRFFEQWVMRAGQPEMDVKWSYADGDLNISFDQKQKEMFVFDLEFEIVYQDGSSERKTVRLDRKNQIWKSKVSGKPTGIALDPDNWLLFEATLTGNNG
ncbi:MAG: M1 family metallopeptidase [Pyrinomonadaceae bacterium]